jgi:hypothetical protein
MKKIALAFFTLLMASGCSDMQQMADQYYETPNPSTSPSPSKTEITSGLKDALQIGITNAVASSSVKNGFYGNSLIRIPVPEEADKVSKTLRGLGMNSLVDEFEQSLNRAAEEASGKAVKVFTDAITQMTIVDVAGVWQGGDNAATQYLKRTSSAQLEQAFAPIIEQAIATTGVTRYWNDIAKVYNSVPFVAPVHPDLNTYVNEKTMDGLFTLVAQEEQNIRQNPAARSTELLQRVFGTPQQYVAQ